VTDSEAAAAFCVTVTVAGVATPVAVIVITADLDEVEELASTEIVMAPLPEPLAGETESHEASSAIDHEVLEVIVNEPEVLAVASTVRVEGVTDSEAAAAFCVTVTVAGVATPVAVIVITADLDEVEEFSSTEMVMAPLPEPLARETESHEASSAIDHEVLADMVNEPEVLAVASTVRSEGETNSEAAAPSCIRVIVCGASPLPVIIISAERVLVRGFDSTLIATEASSEPFIADSVSQSALSETDHDVLDVNSNDPSLFAKLGTDISESEIVNVPPSCVTTKT
jgi:acid stress-induced BolA-like protein IbaG/YrbA